MKAKSLGKLSINYASCMAMKTHLCLYLLEIRAYLNLDIAGWG